MYDLFIYVYCDYFDVLDRLVGATLLMTPTGKDYLNFREEIPYIPPICGLFILLKCSSDHFRTSMMTN